MLQTTRSFDSLGRISDGNAMEIQCVEDMGPTTNSLASSSVNLTNLLNLDLGILRLGSVRGIMFHEAKVGSILDSTTFNLSIWLLLEQSVRFRL